MHAVKRVSKRAIGRAIKRGFEIYYERTLGISSGERNLTAPASRNADATVLQPVSYVCLRRLLKYLRANTLIRGTFLDLGCGTGRVMAFMARTGFDHVSGVEIDEKLAAAARVNTRKYGCEVICGDASNYQFRGTEKVIFLFNPFGPATLREILPRVPEEAAIIFVNPSAAHLTELRNLRGREPQVFDWNPTTAIVR